MRNPQMAITVLFAALVWGLAGCTKVDDGVPPVSGESPVSTGTPSQTTDSVPAGRGPARDDLSFSPYVGAVHEFTATDGNVGNVALKQRSDEGQAFRAECMRERGFVYYPEPWTGTEAHEGWFRGGDQLWLPHLSEDRAEVSRVGYGVMPAEDLSLWDSREAKQNAEYRDSLSPSGRSKYDLALYGEMPSTIKSNSVKSCGELSMEKYPALVVDPGPKDLFRAQFGELSMSMHSLVNEDIAEDPRITSLNATWNGCMANLGYDLLSGFYWNQHNVSPWTAQTLALRTRADGSLGDTWYNYQYDEITPPEERSLLGTPAEIQIALADYDCRRESDYMERYLAVQIDLESAFVERHKTQLDQMMAFAEEHR